MLREKHTWIPLPPSSSMLKHGFSSFFVENQPNSLLLTVNSCPSGVGVHLCAHAQVRRAGGSDENDICQRECQHMGVPVVRDRCLTEEVREGPGFPSCLLCSLPIAQRNTLSEEQREKGKGGGGRPQRRRESQRPIPPGFGCWGAEDYQMNGPLHTHPPLQA